MPGQSLLLQLVAGVGLGIAALSYLGTTQGWILLGAASVSALLAVARIAASIISPQALLDRTARE